MKKNTQNAISSLTVQDKDFQERMEFTKSQGNFFEKVLRPIEDQILKYRFIVDNFYQSAVQLPNIRKKGIRVEDVAQQIREWPKLPALMALDQPLAQEQMREACEAIKEAAYSDAQSVQNENYTVINFDVGTQCWDSQTFSLGNMVLTIKALGGDIHESFDFAENTRLKATIYIGSDDKGTDAFLEVIDGNGKKHFIELKYFSILHLLDTDYRYMDNEGEIGENPITEEKKNREVGMFTLFNKSDKLLFITTY